MQLKIRFTGRDRMNNDQQNLESILTRQLARFQHRLKQVQLYIEDVNGPRGGVDKHCRCVLHLRHMAPIIIRDADASIHAMVHRVAERASHALSRQLERRTSPKSQATGDPSNSRLEFN